MLPVEPTSPDRLQVRPFQPGDRDAMRSLFEGAAAGSPGEALWGHVESEADVYLYPYLDMVPQSVFVAASGDRLVGYLTGCRDGRTLSSESDRIEAAIKAHALYRQASPLRFFARAALDLAVASIRRVPTVADFDDPGFPAHLHINVLPAYRGQGVGRMLIGAWLDKLRRDGSPGCHLGTLQENEAARRFFAQSGFVQIGEPALVPGMRYRGRPVHQIIMVQELGSQQS